MKGLITSAGLLLVGAVLGWWLRDAAHEYGLPQSKVPASSSNSPVSIAYRTQSSGLSTTKSTELAPLSDTTASSSVAKFEQLLSKQDFELAIAHYENMLEIDDSHEALLKPSLEEFLTARLDQCYDDVFVELVDLWLATYYQDISVLLVLAENERLCNSPEEAARTLQIASTYAVQPGAQERVSAAVKRLITTTDKHLSQQQSWIELLGFYEFLQAIDLATNSSQLHRASLYQLLGESQRSQELLVELRENDEGIDSEWTAALELQWSKVADQSSAGAPPRHAIPLTRRGDHFLVTAYINDLSEVTLMIDTGASVTTLTRASFAQIDSTGLAYRGSRIFSTPSGMTQGEVYQTGSITLGSTRLSAPDIAVLDYQSSSGVDGLLGMNVLRSYRFEIDQDENILYLRSRR